MTALPSTATLDNVLWIFLPCLCCDGTGLIVLQQKGEQPQKRDTNQRVCKDCRGTGYQRSGR